MGSVASVNKKASNGRLNRSKPSIDGNGAIPAPDVAEERGPADVETTTRINDISSPKATNEKRQSGEIFRSRAWFIAKLKVGTHDTRAHARYHSLGDCLSPKPTIMEIK